VSQAVILSLPGFTAEVGARARARAQVCACAQEGLLITAVLYIHLFLSLQPIHLQAIERCSKVDGYKHVCRGPKRVCDSHFGMDRIIHEVSRGCGGGAQCFGPKRSPAFSCVSLNFVIQK
jgi:hypothetical protein